MTSYKTAVLLACIGLWPVSHCTGQNANVCQLSLGIGAWSSDELFDGLPLFGGGFKTYNVQQYSSAGTFAFRFFLGKRVTLGLSVAYENESGEWLENVNDGSIDGWESVRIGTFIRQAFTVAPELSFAYLNPSKVRVYCTGGIGATYQNEIDKYDLSYYQSQYYRGVNSLGNNLELANNKTHFNGYLSPIGVSAGGRLRWFCEVGVGYKGIVNTGCSLNLR